MRAFTRVWEPSAKIGNNAFGNACNFATIAAKVEND